jgi:hypothetical protein
MQYGSPGPTLITNTLVRSHSLTNIRCFVAHIPLANAFLKFRELTLSSSHAHGDNLQSDFTLSIAEKRDVWGGPLPPSAQRGRLAIAHHGTCAVHSVCGTNERRCIV